MIFVEISFYHLFPVIERAFDFLHRVPLQHRFFDVGRRIFRDRIGKSEIITRNSLKIKRFEKILKRVTIAWINYHAGGMVVAQPYGFQIDFVRNSISGSAALFLVIILKFIFTLIFAIKIYKKKSVAPKKFHLRSSISMK